MTNIQVVLAIERMNDTADITMKRKRENTLPQAVHPHIRDTRKEVKKINEGKHEY
jgi:hypothetical protein